MTSETVKCWGTTVWNRWNVAYVLSVANLGMYRTSATKLEERRIQTKDSRKPNTLSKLPEEAIFNKQQAPSKKLSQEDVTMEDVPPNTQVDWQNWYIDRRIAPGSVCLLGVELK